VTCLETERALKPTKSTIFAGKSRKLTAAAVWHDQDRHLDLRAVEALAVIKKIILSQPLPWSETTTVSV
jgi:hypothetical protein